MYRPNYENEMAVDAYHEAKKLYIYCEPIYTMRLRSCAAKVLEYRTQFGTTYVLKSYDTIVAYIDEYGNMYDFLRYVYGYTATSAQHIRKFFEDLGGIEGKEYRYKEK